ncbi:MAG: hypothetical protein II137_07735 [Anaerovibrio sp.]|nr:hypothetical protein [Anaerovibrio sp.]
MKDNYFTKEEAMMILYAYEELINLDLALSNALDGFGIEDGGKYKNLWNLPMVLMKYSCHRLCLNIILLHSRQKYISAIPNIVFCYSFN